MRFARLGEPGAEVPVVLTDDGAYSIADITGDIDRQFWERGAVEEVAAALRSGALPAVADAERLRLGSPITRPGVIICIGLNYAAHAAESGAELPASPVLFFKAPNTLAGPNDSVPIPRNSIKTDWEVELGVVIGSRASYLDTVDAALDHIGGFVLANDVSERTFQLEDSGGQWSKGKISPGFSPVGPWLVTPDEIDHRDLRLRSWVNGEARQDSRTSDMVFDVATIIHHLSQYMVLDPGDLILTGTPEGVALSGRFPYLKTGDVMELEIDGLGRQHQELVSHSHRAER